MDSSDFLDGLLADGSAPVMLAVLAVMNFPALFCIFAKGIAFWMA